MKTDKELVYESIEHWKRMVERCKWLIESGHNKFFYVGYKQEFFNYNLNEIPYSKDCPLCKKFMNNNLELSCECNTKNSSWRKTIDYTTDLISFIRLSEKFMIPALYECLKFCKDK